MATSFNDAYHFLTVEDRARPLKAAKLNSHPTLKRFVQRAAPKYRRRSVYLYPCTSHAFFTEEEEKGGVDWKLRFEHTLHHLDGRLAEDQSALKITKGDSFR